MDEKCSYKTPTSADSLEQQIIDPSFPKNEREWWASEEIARLRAEVDLVIAQREAWRVSALTCQRSSAEFAANADRLRAEVEALKAENARLHTANERMRAALERFRCRDWTPDWVRDIANRALEGGE